MQQPEGGSLGDAKSLADFGVRAHLRIERLDLCVINGHRRAARTQAAMRAWSAGLFLPFEPGASALREADTLLLGDGGQDGDHGILEDIAGIEILLRVGAEADAPLREPVEQEQSRQRALAGEPVERPKEQNIEAAIFRIGEHFLERGPVIAFRRDGIAIDAKNLPVLRGDETLHLLELIFRHLRAVPLRNANVDADAHSNPCYPTDEDLSARTLALLETSYLINRYNAPIYFHNGGL